MNKLDNPMPLAPPSKRAPDPILAELWEIKRQLNAEAGYDIDVLARMAHEATERAGIVPQARG